MYQPPAYVDRNYPNRVCRLQKSLYGLKQSPRAWYSKLSSKLQSLGFVPSQADTSLFIFVNQQVIIYMLIYVDDIIITGSCKQAVSNLMQKLRESFAVKDLGKLSYFLGIEVTDTDDGIALTQAKYASDLLQRVNMHNCHDIATPMSSSEKLSKTAGTLLTDANAFKYRSTVGALQYLCLTRPDISFAVNRVCQFLATPTEVHWSTVKRILRYVKGTVNFGVRIQKSSPSSAYTRMQSGQAVPMIGGPLVAMQCFMGLTWCHGAHGSNQPLAGQERRQSTRPLRMEQQKLLGCNQFSEN